MHSGDNGLEADYDPDKRYIVVHQGNLGKRMAEGFVPIRKIIGDEVHLFLAVK